MQINQNFSPSFTGLTMKNMGSLAETLKPGVRKAFIKQSGGLGKFADKHGVDVVFINKTPEAVQESFKKHTEKLLSNVRSVINDACTETADEISVRIYEKFSDVADDTIRATARELGSTLEPEKINEILHNAGEKIDDELADVAAPVVEKAFAHADEALNANIIDVVAQDAGKFDVIISGKNNDSITKELTEIKLPKKKKNFFFFSKKPTMKKLFKEIKSQIKLVEDLNKIQEQFGEKR